MQLNTSHLEMLMLRPGEGEGGGGGGGGGDLALESKSGLYIKMTMDWQVHHHPDTKSMEQKRTRAIVGNY